MNTIVSQIVAARYSPENHFVALVSNLIATEQMHAERLAEALRDMLADSRSLEIRHYAQTQLAAWEGAQ